MENVLKAYRELSDALKALAEQVAVSAATVEARMDDLATAISADLSGASGKAPE
jgi:hypothetical protein